jgi:hypothetical protein
MTSNTRFARGARAVGECGRSGRKMLLRRMVEDGYTPGLMVDPNWYDPPHPQEDPVVTTDAVALEKPAPEQSVPDGEGVAVDPATWLPPL